MNGYQVVRKLSLISAFIEIIRLLFFKKSHFSYFCSPIMVAIAQLVRASDCGSEGRRFEPG